MNFRTFGLFFALVAVANSTGCGGSETSAQALAYRVVVDIENPGMAGLIGRSQVFLELGEGYSRINAANRVEHNPRVEEIPFQPTEGGTRLVAYFTANENTSGELSLRVQQPNGEDLSMSTRECATIARNLTVGPHTGYHPIPTADAPLYLGPEPFGRACRFRRRF